MGMLIEPLGLVDADRCVQRRNVREPDLVTVLIEAIAAPGGRARSRRSAAAAQVSTSGSIAGPTGSSVDPRRLTSRGNRRTVQFAPTVIDDLHAVLDDAVKIVGVSDDFALVARCEAELREHFAGTSRPRVRNPTTSTSPTPTRTRAT